MERGKGLKGRAPRERREFLWTRRNLKRYFLEGGETREIRGESSAKLGGSCVCRRGGLRVPRSRFGREECGRKENKP